MSFFPARPEGKPTRWDAMVLWAVMVAAFVARFYALDVPDLLHDEALVSNAASYDLGYILHRALNTDAHPPYFYFLAKGLMLMGQSNFALRLLSAVAGVTAVFCLYRLGARLFSVGCGLVAGALLAVHPLHVGISRVLRPHSLVMLLGLLSFSALLDFLESKGKRHMPRLLLINFFLLLLHFNCVLLVGTHMAIVAGAMLLRRLPVRTGALFLGISALNMVVNLWPLALRLGQVPGVAINTSMLWTFTRTVDIFASLLNLLPIPWANAVCALLFAAGLLWAWKRRPPLAAALAAMIFLPPAVLIAARYGVIYTPIHIAFLLPFIILLCARAATLPVKPGAARALAAVVAACGLGLLFFQERALLYTEDAPMVDHNLSQRRIAQNMPSPGDVPTIAAFYPPQLLDFVNWHRKRFSSDDLRRNGVGPQDAFFMLDLVDSGGGLAEGTWSPESLGAIAVPPQRTIALPRARIRQWRIERSPVIRAESLPFRTRLSAGAHTFFSQAYSARNLNPYLSPLGDHLTPLDYATPAEFTYRVENATGKEVKALSLAFMADNLSRKTSLKVSLAFDNEPTREVLAYDQVLQDGRMLLLLRRPQGFHTLDITVGMLCPTTHPGFNNLPDSPRFNALEIALDAPDPAFDSDLPVVEAGINPPEQGPCGLFRWGYGPESLLFFHLDEDREVFLDVTAASPIPGQNLLLLLDDAPLGELALPQSQPGSACAGAASSLRIDGKKGSHLIRMRYDHWNHAPGADPAVTFAPGDTRPLAAAFSRLRLRLSQPVESLLLSVTSQ